MHWERNEKTPQFINKLEDVLQAAERPRGDRCGGVAATSIEVVSVASLRSAQPQPRLLVATLAV
ncbi:hypothetical protein CGJ15_25160 [Vibrio parahaemolyticus]|nr:hypothetical protein CGJ15_25160 [Vibrio parahaemolyticus]